MYRAFLFLPSFFVCFVVTPAGAQTSYPMVTHVTPVAVQRGKTSEVTVEGQMNFAGAYKVLFEGAGASAEVVPSTAPQKPPVRSAKLKPTAAPAAPPGRPE